MWITFLIDSAFLVDYLVFFILALVMRRAYHNNNDVIRQDCRAQCRL